MKKDYCHITIVLDRSGSMRNIENDTIGGYNTFLADQKKAPGTATLSLMQFDDKFEDVYEFVNIKDVKELTSETFVPRGWTALYDAIGKSIVATGASLSAMNEEERPEKVVFVIITDGQENSSKEYLRANINQMINTQTEKYSWEFVFLGANIDAEKVGTSFGIKAGNTMTYSADKLGVTNAYSSISSNLTSYRSMSFDNTSCKANYSFFKEEDKIKQNNTNH